MVLKVGKYECVVIDMDTDGEQEGEIDLTVLINNPEEARGKILTLTITEE